MTKQVSMQEKIIIRRAVWACIIILTPLLFVQIVRAQNSPQLQTSHNFQWNYTGNPGFSEGMAWYQDLVFNPVDGLAYVGFEDFAHGGGVTVMKFDGSGWINVGPPGFSAGESIMISLAISPDGAPWVAFVDVANQYKARVMKYNGATWENVGSTAVSNWETDWTNLTFNQSGDACLAYMDYATGQKATVKRYNGTTWEVIGTAGFTPQQAAYTQLITGPDGFLYIAYSRFGLGAGGECSVMRFNGESWIFVGSPNFSGGEAAYLSLAFNPQGELFIGYMDFTHPWKATVRKFNGNAWEVVGSPGFTPDNAEYISLAFNNAGEPHIAFEDQASDLAATVMKFDGDNWVFVGEQGFSGGPAYSTSLAFSPDDEPCVAFEDANNDLKTSVMKYSGQVWIPEAGNETFNIFPNPARDYFNLETKSSMPEARLTVTDCMGVVHMAMTIRSEKEKIEVTSLPAGVYLITIEGSSAIQAKKMVIL